MSRRFAGRARARSALVRLAGRTYAATLRAYPARFRAELGDPMREAFADRCQAARLRGRVSFLRVWLGGLLDSLVNGIAERLGGSPTPGAGRPNPPRSPQRRFTMSLLLDDLKHVSRRLRNDAAFTIAVVLTLAIGIGAFVSIYSVLDNVLWEPMPYDDPDGLAYIWRDYTWADFPRGWAGGVEVLALRQGADAFEDVATVRAGNVNLSSRDGGEPQELPVNLTSANFFDLLGVQPMLGRGFAPGEDVEGAPLVVVLGHALWQQRYAGDEGIVGREIYIDDEAAQVIGVMPASFHFAMHSSLGAPSSGEAYLNLRWDLSQVVGGSLAALARVRPGVDRDVVQAQLDAAIAPIDQEIFDGLGLRLWPAYVHEDLVKDVRPALLAIIGAAAFMLLILCVNLATLLLGRATRRSREMAVSAALGASRITLVRDGMIESLILTLTGGALGLLVARWGTSAIAALAVDLPRRYAIGVDGSVALATLITALGLGVAAGIAPALRAARTDLATALRSAGGRVTGGRAPDAMVVAQVAISLILLVGAGVLSRSFAYLLGSEPGFDSRGVLTLKIPVTFDRFADGPDLMRFLDEIRSGIGELPGVEAVGGVSALPLTAETSQTDVSFPGAPGNIDPDGDQPLIDWFTATPGYFDAIGTPILAGRGFRQGDVADAPPVAIIDDTLAQRFFPGADAVGRTMMFFDIERTVVGVVDQPRLYSLHEDDRGQVFLPLAQRPDDVTSFAIRTSRDPLSVAPEVITLVRRIDPDQPVSEIRTMAQISAEALSGERLSLGLIGGFALGAVLLASLGLYGVISNTVTSRTREMGVRMALGAAPGSVRALVIGKGLRLTLIGAALGLAGSLATGRFLESLLVGVEPTDPLTMTAVAVAMVVVTLVACYLPARRASAVDPLVAMRTE